MLARSYAGTELNSDRRLVVSRVGLSHVFWHVGTKTTKLYQAKTLLSRSFLGYIRSKQLQSSIYIRTKFGYCHGTKCDIYQEVTAAAKSLSEWLAGWLGRLYLLVPAPDCMGGQSGRHPSVLSPLHPSSFNLPLYPPGHPVSVKPAHYSQPASPSFPILSQPTYSIKPASGYQPLRRSWPSPRLPTLPAIVPIVVGLSGSFQLDFVVHETPDGFRRRRTRFIK